VCFSPEADLVVGTVVIAIGVDALRHVRTPRQVPLASIPVLLGAHQVVEAFVWWGLKGQVAQSIEQVALWSYLVFAFSVLPLLLPIAVGLVEPSRARRYVIAACAGLAGAVVVTLTIALLRGPISGEIQGRHIAYQLDALRDGGRMTSLYVIATCGALLASSYRDLERLGALTLAVVPALAWLTMSGFVSLWCFWAAMVSLLIDFHMRRSDQRLWPEGPRPRFTRSTRLPASKATS
jgi:hypothetical protein